MAQPSLEGNVEKSQARRSASAIVRQAMEAHRAKVEAELRALRGNGG
jgi:hypothetical protein